ncbi:hypothetical protein IFU30_01065 [Plantibacter sp. CFBP 8798]|nr:hypothetical protein [Plantibacter sp. CFBP 8798]MBD8464843.1 hypothetical protein [Plantibacter sp. CFBP 8798]
MNHIEIPVSGFLSTSRALINASRRNAAPPQRADLSFVIVGASGRSSPK